MLSAWPYVALANPSEDAAVAQLVSAILQYTQFPTVPSPIRVCIVGEPVYAGALGNIVLPNGQRTVTRTSPPAAGTLPCEVLYLGVFVDRAARQSWIERTSGKAIVTIAEDDRSCHGQAMFCLIFLPNRISFRLNIDAISRSNVSIDPRVLRVAEDP